MFLSSEYFIDIVFLDFSIPCLPLSHLAGAVLTAVRLSITYLCLFVNMISQKGIDRFS